MSAALAKAGPTPMAGAPGATNLPADRLRIAGNEADAPTTEGIGARVAAAATSSGAARLGRPAAAEEAARPEEAGITAVGTGPTPMAEAPGAAHLPADRLRMTGNHAEAPPTEGAVAGVAAAATSRGTVRLGRPEAADEAGGPEEAGITAAGAGPVTLAGERVSTQEGAEIVESRSRGMAGAMVGLDRSSAASVDSRSRTRSCNAFRAGCGGTGASLGEHAFLDGCC